MSYIDPDGLFQGDRMALLSDEARLYWPYFWCASNTVGRVELNYWKVVSRAFQRFKVPITEAKFWTLVREYRTAFLLFVYKSEGSVWGQWDVSERYLPRYKSAQDKRTPAPDHAAMSKWKNEYIEYKLHLSDNSISYNNFVHLEKSVTVCAQVRTDKEMELEVEKEVEVEKERKKPPHLAAAPEPKTETAAVEIEGQEPCEWFAGMWPGPIPEILWRVFGQCINTPEKLQKLRENAPLWALTRKYRDGFTNACAFIESGVYMRPPKKELLAEARAGPWPKEKPDETRFDEIL